MAQWIPLKLASEGSRVLIPRPAPFLFFNKVLELPVLNRTFLGSQKEPKAENLRESFLKVVEGDVN